MSLTLEQLMKPNNIITPISEYFNHIPEMLKANPTVSDNCRAHSQVQGHVAGTDLVFGDESDVVIDAESLHQIDDAAVAERAKYQREPVEMRHRQIMNRRRHHTFRHLYTATQYHAHAPRFNR